ncbi:MAG TPA: response regulator transcription factor [Actinomycetota bacterium]|nr:response regulator transcription factor [Actinomycetota bacterium]
MGSRILVVDDDRKLRDMLRRALEGAGFEVETAEDGGRALAAVSAHAPDLMVLDVLMPGVDGLGVARRLRERGDTTPILMLTARDSISDRVKGLDAGADDYLIKPFSLEELLARVRAMLRRSHGEAEVLRYADVEIDPRTREVRRAGKPVELTAKEFDLLAFFLREPRVVHERWRILEDVWGMESEVGSNVLEVYVGYLRKKLGDPNLIKTVRGIGYALRES